jgi:glucose uptake protein GlcU
MVNKIFERFTLAMLLIFAFIGCVFVSILLHELSHYHDYKDYVEDEYVCGFVWPTSLEYFKHFTEQPAGYFEYTYDSHNKLISDELDIIDRKTEKKAYAISIGILILFFIALFTELLYRLNAHFERLEKERPPETLPDLEELENGR